MSLGELWVEEKEAGKMPENSSRLSFFVVEDITRIANFLKMYTTTHFEKNPKVSMQGAHSK